MKKFFKKGLFVIKISSLVWFEIYPTIIIIIIIIVKFIIIVIIYYLLELSRVRFNIIMNWLNFPFKFHNVSISIIINLFQLINS